MRITESKKRTLCPNCKQVLATLKIQKEREAMGGFFNYLKYFEVIDCENCGFHSDKYTHNDIENLSESY